MSAFIHITGNLGRDPEFKTIGQGTEVAEFSVAVSIYKGRDKPKVTNWYRCTVFGKAAESVRGWHKGQVVQVCGTLESREYTNSAGSKQTSLDINVKEFSNLSKFVGAGGNPDSPAATHTRKEPDADDLPF